MKRKCLQIKWMPGFFVVLVLVWAAPLRAGIYYESTTSSERPRDTIQVKGWVDGAAAKIEFQNGMREGFMPEGSYLVTRDGGKTLFLINPKEKTYSRWDLEAMLETFGQVMEAMGPMMDFSIDNAKVDLLGREPGGTVVGLPTTLYRYHTAYDLNMKVMGIHRGSHIEMDQEIWATDAVDASGLGVWLRSARPTGFEGLDKLLDTEMSKVQGFPLKTVTVTTTTNQKGKKSSSSRSTMEVTVLDRNRDIPGSTFEIPAGYQETEMMPMPGAEGQPAEDDGGQKKGNPLKKLFGGG
jgi:hypothetical protein